MGSIKIDDAMTEGVVFECPTPRPLYTDLNRTQETALVLALFLYTGVATVAFLKFYKRMDASPKKWWTRLVSTWPVMGLIPYTAVGIMAHFVDWQAQTCIVPPNGTWGWWYVFPSSAEFHVKWTGVVEVVGGLSLFVSGIVMTQKSWSTRVRQNAAYVLFFLTIGMTFANVYIITHGAWAYEIEEPIPVSVQAVRMTLQALWLSNLYYMATKESLKSGEKKD